MAKDDQGLFSLALLADRLNAIMAAPSASATPSQELGCADAFSPVTCSPTTAATTPELVEAGSPDGQRGQGNQMAPSSSSRGSSLTREAEPRRPACLARLGNDGSGPLPLISDGREAEEDPAMAVPEEKEAAPAPPDLQVRLNDDPSMGFCVFAKRAFKAGDVLFTERTALEAMHHPDPRGVRNVYRYYSRMSPKRRRALHGSFPVLAWANGVDAFEAAEARFLIGSNVITKGFVLDIALTADDHMRMRPDMAGLDADDDDQPAPWWTPAQYWLAGLFHPATAAAAGSSSSCSNANNNGSRAMRSKSASTSRSRSKSWRRRGHHGWGSDDETDDEDSKSRRSFRSMGSHKSHSSRRSQRSTSGGGGGGGVNTPHGDKAAEREFAERETLKWFSRYAFRLKAGTAFTDSGAHQAAVYLLTDLLNHRCTPYQNCRVQPRIGFVSVIAERDIEPEEEVTINYHKSVKDFVCKGECCRQ